MFARASHTFRPTVRPAARDGVRISTPRSTPPPAAGAGTRVTTPRTLAPRTAHARASASAPRPSAPFPAGVGSRVTTLRTPAPPPNGHRTAINPSLLPVTAAAAERLLQTSIDSLTHTHWAMPKRAEPVCHSVRRYLALGYPPPFTNWFCDRLPQRDHQTAAGVESLSSKGTLYTDDDNTVALARKPFPHASASPPTAPLACPAMNLLAHTCLS